MSQFGNTFVPGQVQKKDFLIPWGVYASISPHSGASNGAYAYTIGKDIKLIEWYQAFLVYGTNNPSNYWNIDLLYGVAPTTQILIATISTLPATGTTITRYYTKTFSLSSLIMSSHLALYVFCNKIGSPGNLYLYGPHVLATEN